MKLTFIAVMLVAVLMLAGTTHVMNKRESVTRKTVSTPVRFDVKDYPEHGIYLIAPSDPSVAYMLAKVTKSKANSISDSYSVILKNTGNQAVVGYRIKWECVDSGGADSAVDTSNIVSWLFLIGDESDRRVALNTAKEIIKPNSTWLISHNAPARPLESQGDRMDFVATDSDGSSEAEPIRGCVRVTAIADGIFFDDGTFIGPDTTNFFTEVKSQMDARHEILSGIQNDLKAGKNAGEIFRGLEKIRDQETVRLGDHPTPDEFRTYFRNIFAQDVLGDKELWGPDKALQTVQQQLSKQWVSLRKL